MIKSLQSFRFFAIIMVFFSHLLFMQDSSTYSYIFNRFLYDGYSGVTFFIILSGFVISYSYYNKINDYSVKNSISFVIRRLKRVYPLHILTLVIAMVFEYKSLFNNSMLFFGKTLSNITLTQSIIPMKSIYFSFNAVSWYISASVVFYIFTPLIICTVKKVKENNKKLWFIIVLLYLVELFFVFFTKNSLNAHWLVYINPFFRILDYIIGCILGVIALKKRESVTENINYSVLEVVSLISLIVAYLFYPSIGQVYRYGVYYAPLFILIIYVFSFEKGFLSKNIFNHGILVYLGTISFEFYMIHQLVIRFVTSLFPLDFPILISLACFVISIIASMILNKLLNGKNIFKV